MVHAVSKNIQVQPYIVIVGNTQKFSVDAVYVIIDKIEYEVSNLLQGLDICFKSFHVLNAAYTRQSEQIWLLLQIGVYRFRTKFDAQLNCVYEVLHDVGLNVSRD